MATKARTKIDLRKTLGGIIDIKHVAIANGAAGIDIRFVTAGIAEYDDPISDVLFSISQGIEIAKVEGSPLRLQILLIGHFDETIIASQAIAQTDHIRVADNRDLIVASINRVSLGKVRFLNRIHEIVVQAAIFRGIEIQVRAIETLAIAYEAIGISTKEDDVVPPITWYIAPGHIGIAPALCSAQQADSGIASQIEADFDQLWLQSEAINLNSIPTYTDITTKIRSSVPW